MTEISRKITKQDVLDAVWFDLKKVAYIDIETGNEFTRRGEVDPWRAGARIALVQTNIDGNIKLHDWNQNTRDYLDHLNDQGYTFVGHNLEFELSWFLVHGDLRLTRVVDTMLLSQVLNAGKVKVDEATEYALRASGIKTDDIGQWDALLEEDEDNVEAKEKKASRFSHNLAATAYRYADARMSKTEAESDWLHRPLTPEQIRYAEDDVRHLERIMKNLFYFGVKYGLMKTMELECRTLPVVSSMRHNGILLDRVVWEQAAADNQRTADTLKEELDRAFGLEVDEQDEELDNLFAEPVQRKFSVTSDKQLKEFFKIEKADEAHLVHIDHPLIPKLLKFKESKKLASTYGEGFLKWIKADGRLHSALMQAATATGRFSSNKPNLQNIPPDMLKMFLRAKEDYVLLTIDYSSVESRILAYAANDPAFIDSVNTADVHSANARKIFKIPDGVPVDKELRRKAKGLSFGIPYGISANGIVARGFAETKEEAQQMLDDFFAAFPMVKKFLQQSVYEATVRGYTQDDYGRIRWYEIPEIGKVDEEIYRAALGSATRQGQNHKIQSLSASITKLALVMCEEYLRETGYGNIILTVHDSIFFEVKKEYAHIAGPVICDLMASAGPMVLAGSITPVDADYGIYEKRTCKVSGMSFKCYDLAYLNESVIRNPQSISEDTAAALWSMGIKLPSDYKEHSDLDFMGYYAEALVRIKHQDEDWHSKHKKFVQAIQKLEGSRELITA